MAKSKGLVDMEAAALAKKLDDDLNDFIQEQVKVSHEMRGGAPKHEPTLEELIEVGSLHGQNVSIGSGYWLYR